MTRVGCRGTGKHTSTAQSLHCRSRHNRRNGGPVVQPDSLIVEELVRVDKLLFYPAGERTHGQREVKHEIKNFRYAFMRKIGVCACYVQENIICVHEPGYDNNHSFEERRLLEEHLRDHAGGLLDAVSSEHIFQIAHEKVPAEKSIKINNKRNKNLKQNT